MREEVRSLDEARSWFLRNQTGAVVGIWNGKEQVLNCFPEAERFFLGVPPKLYHLELTRDELTFLIHAMGYLCGGKSKEPEDSKMRQWAEKYNAQVMEKIPGD